MKKRINTFINWIKSHKIISGVVALILLFILYKIVFPGGTQHETYIVKSGDVVQKVIVNGNTRPVDSVDLSFETSGTVAKVYAPLGTRVQSGQTLVALDSGTTYANYLKAKANLQGEQAKLDDLKNGTRPEELAVSQTEVDNAQTAVNDAEKSLQGKVVDIINNNVDQLFSNPHTNIATINLVLYDSDLKNKINNERVVMENVLNTWSANNVETYFPQVSSFIDHVALAVNTQSASPTLSQTTIDGYKSALSSARASLVSEKQSLNNAQASLMVAEKNLALKKAGATPEAIAAEAAQVLEMQAQFESASSELSKMTLRSPQNGIVTREDAKVGQTVTPGTVVVSIISDNNLEIEANVSEINIGKVAIGNQAAITFDAFPGQTYEGKVTYIEPGETIVDGVVNYKVKVAFSKLYPEIKSGLTCKLEIITGTKNNVLVVPQYSLKTKDNETFVLKKEGKNYVEVPVTVGLKGQDGSVEVISGLISGDIIDTISVK